MVLLYYFIHPEEHSFILKKDPKRKARAQYFIMIFSFKMQIYICCNDLCYEKYLSPNPGLYVNIFPACRIGKRALLLF